MENFSIFVLSCCACLIQYYGYNALIPLAVRLCNKRVAAVLFLVCVLLLRQDPQFLQEGINILEFSVYRSEANIRNYINVSEMSQNKLSDLLGGNLGYNGILKLCLNC